MFTNQEVDETYLVLNKNIAILSTSTLFMKKDAAKCRKSAFQLKCVKISPRNIQYIYIIFVKFTLFCHIISFFLSQNVEDGSISPYNRKNISYLILQYSQLLDKTPEEVSCNRKLEIIRLNFYVSCK